MGKAVEQADEQEVHTYEASQNDVPKEDLDGE
jgi:hypothetical protein